MQIRHCGFGDHYTKNEKENVSLSILKTLPKSTLRSEFVHSMVNRTMCLISM